MWPRKKNLDIKPSVILRVMIWEQQFLHTGFAKINRGQAEDVALFHGFQIWL